MKGNGKGAIIKKLALPISEVKCDLVIPKSVTGPIAERRRWLQRCEEGKD
jgi:hypothetical protein